MKILKKILEIGVQLFVCTYFKRPYLC